MLFGTTTYQTDDGSEGLVGDVRLAYDPDNTIPVTETNPNPLTAVTTPPLTAAEALGQREAPTPTAAIDPGPADAELNRLVDQLRADMAAFDPSGPVAAHDADLDLTDTGIVTDPLEDVPEENMG